MHSCKTSEPCRGQPYHISDKLEWKSPSRIDRSTWKLFKLIIVYFWEIKKYMAFLQRETGALGASLRRDRSWSWWQCSNLEEGMTQAGMVWISLMEISMYHVCFQGIWYSATVPGEFQDWIMKHVRLSQFTKTASRGALAATSNLHSLYLFILQYFYRTS